MLGSGSRSSSGLTLPPSPRAGGSAGVPSPSASHVLGAGGSAGALPPPASLEAGADGSAVALPASASLEAGAGGSAGALLPPPPGTPPPSASHVPGAVDSAGALPQCVGQGDSPVLISTSAVKAEFVIQIPPENPQQQSPSSSSGDSRNTESRPSPQDSATQEESTEISEPNLKIKYLLGGKNISELKEILQQTFKDDKYQGNSYGIFNKFFDERSRNKDYLKRGFPEIFNEWAEQKIRESYKKRLIFAISNAVLLAVAVIVGTLASGVAGYSLGLVSGIVFGFLEATSKRNIQTLGHLRESLADKIGKAVEKTIEMTYKEMTDNVKATDSIDNSQKRNAGISRGLSYLSGLGVGFVSFLASRIEAMSTFATGLSYAIPVVSLLTLGLSFLNNYFRKKHAESKIKILNKPNALGTDGDVKNFKQILIASDSQGKSMGDNGYKKIQSENDLSKLITAGNFASSKVLEQFTKNSAKAKAIFGEDITKSNQNEIVIPSRPDQAVVSSAPTSPSSDRKKGSNESDKSSNHEQELINLLKSFGESEKKKKDLIDDHADFSSDMNDERDRTDFSGMEESFSNSKSSVKKDEELGGGDAKLGNSSSELHLKPHALFEEDVGDDGAGVFREGRKSSSEFPQSKPARPSSSGGFGVKEGRVAP